MRAPTRFFYQIYGSMCSFWWRCLQLENLCPVKHFCFNHHTYQPISGFYTSIPRFSSRRHLVWLQTNGIFDISAKHCLDSCVFQMVYVTFISGRIFSPSPSQGYIKKSISSKNYFGNGNAFRNSKNDIWRHKQRFLDI